MKKATFLLLLALSVPIFSQTKNDTIKAIAEQAVDSFMKKFEIELKEDRKVKLGTFKLINDGKAPIWVDKKVIKDSVVIDSVFMEIVNGEIIDIRAFEEKGDNSFYYNISPTNIFSFMDNPSSLLLRNNINPSRRIKLLDIVSYDYETGKHFLIDQSNVRITKKDSIFPIYVDNNLKSFIDFRIYSDFLGLIDESSNGIVSFEGNSTFFLNPYSLGRYTYVFKKFQSHLRYSRFDNDDRTVSIPLSDTLDLRQRSFLHFGGQRWIYSNFVQVKNTHIPLF